MAHWNGCCKLWVRVLFSYMVWPMLICIVRLLIPRKHAIASLSFLKSRSCLSFPGSQTFRNTYNLSRKVKILYLDKNSISSCLLSPYSLLFSSMLPGLLSISESLLLLNILMLSGFCAFNSAHSLFLISFLSISHLCQFISCYS